DCEVCWPLALIRTRQAVRHLPTGSSEVPMVQVKKAEVREAILEAATQLFFEKGYVGTSTSEIGQRAAVAPSAIYTYFESKLDLFYRVYSPWLKTRLDRLERDLDSIDGHRTKVRHIVETIWREIPNEQ